MEPDTVTTPKINKTTTGVLLDSSDKVFVIGLRILVLIKIKAVVKNRKISGYYAWKDDINNAGGIFVDEPCVIDKNLVTSPHYKYNGQWMKGVIEVEKKQK